MNQTKCCEKCLFSKLVHTCNPNPNGFAICACCTYIPICQDNFCPCHKPESKCQCGYEKGNGHSQVCPLFKEESLEEVLDTRQCVNGHLMRGIGFDDCCPECEEPWKTDNEQKECENCKIIPGGMIRTQDLRHCDDCGKDLLPDKEPEQKKCNIAHHFKKGKELCDCGLTNREFPKPANKWEMEFRKTFAEYATHQRLNQPAFMVWAIEFIKSLHSQGYKQGQEDEAVAHQKEDIKVRKDTLAEVEKKLKKIAMYHHNGLPCYQVAEVLNVLEELK